MPRHSRKRNSAESGSHDTGASSHTTAKSKKARYSTSASARGYNRNPSVATMVEANPLNIPFTDKQCMAWFQEYTTGDSNLIEPLGMEKFCEDIGVEPENIVMLSLAYTLGAESMGFFTEAEWFKGMRQLQCDCTVKLQHKLDYLRSLLNDPVTFKTIFRYAFDFAREKDQRSMDIGTAKEMLALLLGKQWPLFGSFSQYLEQSKFRVINKDQWQNVLEFSRLVLADLSNYDEDGAWPVMMDDFVEWYKETNPATSMPSTSSTSMS